MGSPAHAGIDPTRVLDADDKFRGRQFRTRGEMMAEQLNKQRLEAERQNSNPQPTAAAGQ